MRTCALNRRLRIFRQKLAGRASLRRTGVVFLCAALFLAAYILIAIKLQPIVVQTAQYAVGDVVTELVNEAIEQKASEGSLDYEELVTLETDEKGNITALRTNTAKVNLLRSEITSYVIENVSKDLTTVIKIPFGNIFGVAILSGRGPGIPVRIVSVTDVTATFSNEFTSAGINQTRHQIILDITVDTEALIPASSIVNSVTTSMVVAETVIVGAVPETYAYLR